MNKKVLIDFLPLTVLVINEMIEYCREVLSLTKR